MGWVVNATPRQIYHRERPGTHFIGGWVGPRDGLEGCGKCRLLQGLNLLTFQATQICYED